MPILLDVLLNTLNHNLLKLKKIFDTLYSTTTQRRQSMLQVYNGLGAYLVKANEQ